MQIRCFQNNGQFTPPIQAVFLPLPVLIKSNFRMIYKPIITITMKKTYLLFLTMFLSLAVLNAQPKKVGYFTYNKTTMDLTASSVGIDPIIRMLQADPNLDVTVNITEDNETVDLTGYDVVIVQESYNGASPMLTPGHTLALDTFMVPVVFNKTFAFKAGRALATGEKGAGAETKVKDNFYLRVSPANQSNDLFKGITFDGDSVALFKICADDYGVTVNPAAFKAINYARAVVIKDAGGDTIENTLLAVPAITDPTHTDITLCFNDFPAGTTIGSETLKARMITLGMNFGAISAGYGTNITDAGLTVWRNAVYIAAGLAVPDEPVAFRKWEIGYFTLKGKVLVSSAAPVDQDPIYTMLKTGNEQWNVNLNMVAADSVFDISAMGYDAIVVQESFSGSSKVFKPDGSLALAKFTVPFVFNKNYALAGDRAFTVGTSGSGAESEGQLRLKVNGDIQSNPLFSGIEFAEDSTIALVKVGAADDGGTSRTKAMNYAEKVKLSDTLGTRLALPVGVTNATVGTVSDIPAGDSIGSEVLQARMIVVGMNFGAICKDRGTNMTSAGLTLWRNAVHSALGLPIPKTAVPQTIPDVKVILVSDDDKDDLQLKFLQKNGLIAERLTLTTGRRLSIVGQDTVDMLNAADLVIIGRSNASSDFGSSDSATRAAWNHMTVPIILNSQWIARNSRLNWFPSGTANQNNDPGIYQGTAKNTADPIFAFSTFDANSTTDWTYRADDWLSVTAPFNGDTVVYREGCPLVVRFMEDSAFYPGALDTVMAPRTYFGFGNDNAGPFNYFNLTASAQAAYYGEIMRITGNTVIEPLYYVSADATLKLIMTTPGALAPAFAPEVLEYELVLPVGTDTVTITPTANSPLATVTGGGVIALTEDTTVVSIYATAENLRKGDTYVITVIVEQPVTPGFEDLTEAGISLYPNPAYDNLTLSGLQGSSSIRITNSVGQLVYSKQVDGSKALINISSLKNGLYVIQVEMNGEIVTTKFIKQ